MIVIQKGGRLFRIATLFPYSYPSLSPAFSPSLLILALIFYLFFLLHFTSVTMLVNIPVVILNLYVLIMIIIKKSDSKVSTPITCTAEVRKPKRNTKNSNKSPTRCNSFPVYYPDVHLQLNIFPHTRPDHEHSTAITTIRRSSIGAGLVGRWAIPPGPKFKKWGCKRAPPKFGPIWGQLPIFEFLKILSFGPRGSVAHFLVFGF